jgi:hypothetical protein
MWKRATVLERVVKEEVFHDTEEKDVVRKRLMPT